jgi:hypothetical protein
VETAADVRFSARYHAQPSESNQYGVKGLSVVQGAMPCQEHWHQVHAIRGEAGVHVIRVSMLMNPAHALTSTENPLETKNPVVVEPCSYLHPSMQHTMSSSLAVTFMIMHGQCHMFALTQLEVLQREKAAQMGAHTRVGVLQCG